jgi:hypothetical protein
MSRKTSTRGTLTVFSARLVRLDRALT